MNPVGIKPTEGPIKRRIAIADLLCRGHKLNLTRQTQLVIQWVPKIEILGNISEYNKRMSLFILIYKMFIIS